ncbi:MAG: hypothetical protein U1F77_09500 [Kiritimatiellia bacterium]
MAAQKFDDALNLCLYAAGMASRANDPAREEKAYRAAVPSAPNSRAPTSPWRVSLAEADRHKDALVAFREGHRPGPQLVQGPPPTAASAIEIGEYQSASSR